MSARALGLVLASLLLTGCIGAITVAQPTPEPPPPPVPPRFKAEAAPELVASPVAGCQAAPALDPNLYYCAADEHWYLFAMNRWYLAFAWDGNWFPVARGELPEALAEITPKTKQETTKTREERLEELERKLEKLDEEEQTP